MKVICNKTYMCQEAGTCRHAVPHRPGGAGCDGKIGGSIPICQGSGLVSICVPVKNKRYVDNDHCECICPTCGHIHSHPVSKSRSVKTRKTKLKGVMNGRK